MEIEFDNKTCIAIHCDFNVPLVTARRIVERISEGDYYGLTLDKPSPWRKTSEDPPPKDGTVISAWWTHMLVADYGYWNTRMQKWDVLKGWRTIDPDYWMPVATLPEVDSAKEAQKAT